MSEMHPIQNVTEMSKQPDAVPGPVLGWGVSPLLSAQADLLAGAEATVTDWLHRRHEAVVDTQQLIARIHTGGDPTEALRAQQEWMSRSFQRLAADADACHSAIQRLLDRVPSWFPHGGWTWFPWGAASSETANSQAAATRAASHPLRMANTSE